MFCPKCGNRLNDNENICSKCGWSKNIDKENVNTSIVNLNQDSESVNANEIIPQIRFHGVTKRLILIIGAVLLIIIGIILVAHFNSDSYKLNKAAELLYNSQYTEAVNKLSGVYDPQAELIRNYIKVLQARDNFIDTYDTDAISNVLVNDNYDYVVEAANQFKTAVYEFNQNENLYLMPEQLRTQFNYYIGFCEQIDSCYSVENFEKTLYSLYYQPQNVFLNSPTRNRNDTFTLSDMQYNIDISKAGVDLLSDWIYTGISDFSNSENKFTGLSDDNCPNEFLYFYNSTVDLISYCNAEIESEQALIDDNLKKFDIDDELYLTDPDESYTSYVLYDLEEIADASNIGNNATTFQNTYYVDMMAYCLHHE